MTETQRYYTLQELADMLRVTRQTLYNNIRKGKLHPTKFGKEYRIPETELQQILATGYGGRKANPNK